jgi:hypothetical protein
MFKFPVLSTVSLHVVPFGLFRLIPAPSPPTYKSVISLLPIVAVFEPLPTTVITYNYLVCSTNPTIPNTAVIVCL